ncbi:hypothetical protein TRFO_29570 [Tritrichomonas foetus]|uniref:Protein kinase domain-containing protein n=1 Tax=Tritrichomonas foetus TaxID=1144522 RepID=A0A1J4JVQ9_9EUKA|nr:hypothetical protein TRFO_29570 [Tritrichomonas foetus]|eukprot:OHT03099.1 hypothetical protein TRFO_29570 [Tritrichomonas foetus]
MSFIDTNKDGLFINEGTMVRGYIFGECIGKGGYASVFKVKSIKFPNLEFVAKVVLPTATGTFPDLEKDSNINPVEEGPNFDNGRYQNQKLFQNAEKAELSIKNQSNEVNFDYPHSHKGSPFLVSPYAADMDYQDNNENVNNIQKGDLIAQKQEISNSAFDHQSHKNPISQIANDGSHFDVNGNSIYDFVNGQNSHYNSNIPSFTPTKHIASTKSNLMANPAVLKTPSPVRITISNHLRSASSVESLNRISKRINVSLGPKADEYSNQKSKIYQDSLTPKKPAPNGLKACKAWESFDSEVNALLKLDHPHIIRMYEYFTEQNYFFVILEYCSKGSLADEVKRNGPIKGHRLITLAQQLIGAVAYAHSQKIAHRDIKPQNILFDNFGRIKLADFGISICKSCDHDIIMNYKCSPAYAAPEVLSLQPHDIFKSDIWSLGVTLFYMASGKLPFIYRDTQQILRDMRTLGPSYPVGQSIPPDLYDIIKKMLTFHPHNRINIEDAQNMMFNRLNTIKLSGIGQNFSNVSLNVIQTAVSFDVSRKIQPNGGDSLPPLEVAPSASGLSASSSHTKISSRNVTGSRLVILQKTKVGNESVKTSMELPMALRMKPKAVNTDTARRFS